MTRLLIATTWWVGWPWRSWWFCSFQWEWQWGPQIYVVRHTWWKSRRWRVRQSREVISTGKSTEEKAVWSKRSVQWNYYCNWEAKSKIFRRRYEKSPAWKWRFVVFSQPFAPRQQHTGQYEIAFQKPHPTSCRRVCLASSFFNIPALSICTVVVVAFSLIYF